MIASLHTYNSSASDTAWEFLDGLEDRVYWLAYLLAEKHARTRKAIPADAPVEVELQDVRRAADEINSALQSQLGVQLDQVQPPPAESP